MEIVEIWVGVEVRLHWLMCKLAVDAVILVTTVQQLAAKCSVIDTAIAGTWYYYLLQVAVGSSGK